MADDVSPVLYFPPRQYPGGLNTTTTTTPSPFTFSVASTAGWSSRSSFRLSNLFLRFFALLLSFISALSLATTPTSTHQKSDQKDHLPASSFLKYPQLMYCFIVAIVAAVYSAYQLFKGVCDIAYRGLFISDKISDYLTFTLDQLVCYLLISSSSVSIPVIDRLVNSNKSLEKAAIVSVTMSFASFFVIAICTLLSGYKLCKRIIW